MSSVYQINKGINKPIEFKGLYGQYIGWLAGGLVVLLLTFVALYLLGAGLLITVPLVFTLGGGLIFTVFRLSKRFGVHGLGKFFAKRGLPTYVRFRSRRVFTTLKTSGKVAA
ncbi:DUF4133 domain-containing protein [Mucilaginibacter sp. ZT4R22]|uniref:DUF4133 domain-containing protein n=1 Tax=Mucilaginibacter pankratovii TaxID=2772110 RepID=A0ABR7WWB6_9SPHI|nr:DUF4133 domain-containing protein [Mucilaginibacter pankratovii]MBD1366570.1 DUF4133 domain-containing protein [Mucilaginibacter pankratovii]